MSDKFTAKDVTLYWGSGSPPCFKVMIALEEKGLGEYNSEYLLFSKDEQKSKQVTDLNPRAELPTMKIKVGRSEVIVNESDAAILFLESALHGSGTDLIPSDVKEKALVFQRMAESANVFHKGLEKVAYVRIFVDEKAELSAERKAFLEELAIWEGYLKKDGPFLCGAKLTAADVAMFPNLAFLVHGGFKLATRFPCVAKYCELMEKRPSVQKIWLPLWKDWQTGYVADL